MSMLHNDSYNDGINTGKRVAAGCVTACLAILTVLGITLAANGRNGNSSHYVPPAATSAVSVSEDAEDSTDTLTSDQLSFWNMYDSDGNVVVSDDTGLSENRAESMSTNRPQVPVSDNGRFGLSDNKGPDGMSVSSDSVSSDEFNVNEEKEQPEYVKIDDKISKTTLFDQGFQKQGDRLVYALNGRKTSHFGIDVSKYTGAVSWNRVKAAGAEFAMLRLGSRGYSTGTVNLDDTFQTNFDGCTNAGIDVGVYFFSQAVNVNEAVEEANYCVAALNGRKIKYPVVFDTEEVQNDGYRTQNLSRKDLSACAIAFCSTIRQYGYIPMISGTKKQLVKHLDLRELADYDIWLQDTDETSVYPYRYTMRQYSDSGKIDGIDGSVNYDICFISYADK